MAVWMVTEAMSSRPPAATGSVAHVGAKHSDPEPLFRDSNPVLCVVHILSSADWTETLTTNIDKLHRQCHESHSHKLAVVGSESARVGSLDVEQRETREEERKERRRAETRGEVSRRCGEKVNGCARPSAS